MHAEEWIEIPVPALIDEPIFARAQELLQENKVRARRRTITPSLMQGLVSCRRCDYALSRTSTRSSAHLIHLPLRSARLSSTLRSWVGDRLEIGLGANRSEAGAAGRPESASKAPRS